MCECVGDCLIEICWIVKCVNVLAIVLIKIKGMAKCENILVTVLKLELVTPLKHGSHPFGVCTVYTTFVLPYTLSF